MSYPASVPTWIGPSHKTAAAPYSTVIAYGTALLDGIVLNENPSAGVTLYFYDYNDVGTKIGDDRVRNQMVFGTSETPRRIALNARMHTGIAFIATSDINVTIYWRK